MEEPIIFKNINQKHNNTYCKGYLFKIGYNIVWIFFSMISLT